MVGDTKRESSPGCRPKRLFVYECRGPKLPRRSLQCEGFLGLWPEPPFFYLFLDHQDDVRVREWVASQQGWTLQDTYELDYDAWQDVPDPLHQVGPFLIRTVVDDRQGADSAEGIPIRLNPGVVFGSGLHASTRGCLMAIATLFSEYVIKSVVDLGTGTGILALAAARLGARNVVALDCNPLAVGVAQENVAVNALQGVVELLVARELSVLREPSDLLLMNLEWPCLQEVLRGEDWLGYRWVVLSGFLQSQWPVLKMAIPSYRCIVHREILDDWMTVVVSAA